MSKTITHRLRATLPVALLGLLFASTLAAVGAPIQSITIPTRPAPGYWPLPHQIPDRPRLVLALSGGALRGAAHIGVLEILDSAGIAPDGIAGVSIGALVGGLYAAGYSPSELASRLGAVDWGGVLFDKPERPTLALARKEEHSRQLLLIRLNPNLTPFIPGAVTPGQKLYRVLLGMTLKAPYQVAADWRQLRTPLEILATDMVSGAPTIFKSGDLAFGIRGSLSLPLLFDPLPYDSLRVIDGGIAENIPVSVARAMGGDVVLAVNVSARLLPVDDHYEPWQIVDQVTTILEQEATSRSLGAADIVITPKADSVEFANPASMNTLIAAGREAMRRALPDLMRRLKLPATPEDGISLRISRVIYAGETPDVTSSSESTNAPKEWLERPVTIGEVREYLARLLDSGSLRDAAAEYDSSSGLLTLKITPLPPLTAVRFSGDRIFSDDRLQAPFLALLHRPLNYCSLRAATETLLRQFRENDYPVARITENTFDESSGVLEIALDAGRLKEIKFSGLKRVSQSLLANEIPLAPGSPITAAGLTRGIANLYATDLFRTVMPVLASPERAGGGWTIVIHISEQPGLPLRLGLAYQGERRTRGFAELIYAAPFYYANRIVAYTAVGERDREHSLTLQADRIGGLPLTSRVAGYFQRRERTRYDDSHSRINDYTEERLGGELEAGGLARSWGLLSAFWRLENHRDLYGEPALKYRLSALGAKLAVDTQDRSPFPRSGVKFSGTAETSGDYLGSDATYTKFWGLWEGDATPVRRATFALRFGGGIADKTTPRDELLRLGGMESFPGLHLDERVGGMQVSAGGETRYDLISRFLADTYIGARYDVGGGWSDPDQRITQRDWMPSLAVYVALDTYLGPIKLQWSHLFHSGAAKGQNLLLLQAGNLF